MMFTKSVPVLCVAKTLLVLILLLSVTAAGCYKTAAIDISEQEDAALAPLPEADPYAEHEVPDPVDYGVPLDRDLQEYILGLCDDYKVPPALIYALMSVESSFQADAVSDSDDYGLTQINKINHEWLRETLGVTDFLDPKQNALCGVYILSGHLEKYDGDINQALMAYHMGTTGARRLWNEGIYETRYTAAVMDKYREYKEAEKNA